MVDPEPSHGGGGGGRLGENWYITKEKKLIFENFRPWDRLLSDMNKFQNFKKERKLIAEMDTLFKRRP